MNRLQTNYPGRQIGNHVDYEALKRQGFKDQGLVIVSVDDPRLSWDQREMIKQVGEKLYGRRSC